MDSYHAVNLSVVLTLLLFKGVFAISNFTNICEGPNGNDHNYYEYFPDNAPNCCFEGFWYCCVYDASCCKTDAKHTNAVNLSDGAIAGIVVGSVAGVFITFLVIWGIYKYKQSKRVTKGAIMLN